MRLLAPARESAQPQMPMPVRIAGGRRDDRPARQLLSQFVLLVPVAAFLLGCLWAFGNTADDAFISFRYAQNLASGHGLVFNPGERLEGFSNPLWVLLATPFERLGDTAVIGMKVVGILCGMLAIWLTWRIARRHCSLGPFSQFALLMWLSTNVGFIYYAVSGLETVLYAAQVVALTYLVLEGRFKSAAVVCALLVITRPEGALLAGPLVLGMWLERRSLREVMAALSIPLAVGAALVCLRYLYYGTLLPNSFHAKVSTQLAPLSFLTWHTHSFLIYSADFARQQLMEGFLLFSCALGVVALATRRQASLVASLGVLVFFVWVSAGDWMSFSRFYVHALPLIGLCAFQGLQLVSKTVGRQLVFVALMSAPVAWNVATSSLAIGGLNKNTEFNPAMHSRNHVAIGQYLKSVADPGDAIVTNEVGAIGYYSGLTVMDMLGLTDRTVAGLLQEAPVDECAAYLLAKKPRYVLLNDREGVDDPAMPSLHQAIYDQLMGSGAYQNVRSFPLNTWKNAILFVRIPAR